MKQPITLQWVNTCTTSEPTSISIQRCKNVGFYKSGAEIEVIAQGIEDGLNPTLDTGWYIDNDVEHGESYSYRVLTHRDDQKIASVSTNFIHCINFTTDLGYPAGEPKKTSRYNIKQTPALHVDATRLVDSITHVNDNITNASSLLRSNSFIDNINTSGDPIIDLCDITHTKMISKTLTSILQSNTTHNIKQSNLYYNVSDNKKLTQYTIFAVIYDDYNTADTQNIYNISPGCTIKWNNKEITVDTCNGVRTTTRSNNSRHKLVMLRVCESQTRCWESNTLFYSKKNKKKHICSWSPNKRYNIIPNYNNSHSSGLCEYILFDHAVDYVEGMILSQYLSNKYSIETNSLNIRDLNY